MLNSKFTRCSRMRPTLKEHPRNKAELLLWISSSRNINRIRSVSFLNLLKAYKTGIVIKLVNPFMLKGHMSFETPFNGRGSH